MANSCHANVTREGHIADHRVSCPVPRLEGSGLGAFFLPIGPADRLPNAEFVTGLNTITMTVTTGDGLWDSVRIAFTDVEGITAATPVHAALRSSPQASTH